MCSNRFGTYYQIDLGDKKEDICTFMFMIVKIRLFLVPKIFDPLKNSQDPPGEFWTMVRGHILG